MGPPPPLRPAPGRESAVAASELAGAVVARERSGQRIARATLVFCAALAVLAALFARFVVQDFGAPISGTGDGSLWDHQTFYVGRNLTFTPLPRLDLHNDQLFYPYGGNNVFQPWIMEMHLGAALATRLAGLWGWSQLYFLFSITVTALGAFLLLLRDHGAWRAALAAVAVSFLNYYAIGRFAGALANACAHWAVLSVLADSVIAGRLVVGRPWSARLLAARCFLLVASLGQDMGYVAGLGLTSGLLTALFSIALALGRSRCRPARLASRVREAGQELAASARSHPLEVACLAVATLLVGLLYVPLALQISRAAAEYDFSRVHTGTWWANPLRLLMPVLPGFNPVSHHRILADQPEAFFAASPGLAFVLAAIVGLVAGRRRVLAAVPALLLLVLLLSFHPQSFALLKLLPWFGFIRVSGRFSVVYPALLVSLALLAPAGVPRRRAGRVFMAALLVLAAVEASTAFSTYLIKDWHHFRPSPAFSALTEAIRSAPGEAVFDWPFCVAGGNGIGTNQLCRFYGLQSGAAWLQIHHHKKIVGKYFGRLHPDQIEPYLQAGWPRLFSPDKRDVFKARKQQRDFSPDEWTFLAAFLRKGDFSGILLYTDLLPNETIAGFHARFGPSSAVAESPYGMLEFIPRQGAWQVPADPEGARRLRLPPAGP